MKKIRRNDPNRISAWRMSASGTVTVRARMIHGRATSPATVTTAITASVIPSRAPARSLRVVRGGRRRGGRRTGGTRTDESIPAASSSKRRLETRLAVW